LLRLSLLENWLEFYGNKEDKVTGRHWMFYLYSKISALDNGGGQADWATTSAGDYPRVSKLSIAGDSRRGRKTVKKKWSI
jgi:hypothetical protein